MALTVQQGAKLIEIYKAIDAKQVAVSALSGEHAIESAALGATHDAAIKALVVQFKALGGTSDDYPLLIQQYLGIFNGT